jgi:hypothetical protein
LAFFYIWKHFLFKNNKSLQQIPFKTSSYIPSNIFFHRFPFLFAFIFRTENFPYLPILFVLLYTYMWWKNFFFQPNLVISTKNSPRLPFSFHPDSSSLLYCCCRFSVVVCLFALLLYCSTCSLLSIFFCSNLIILSHNS